MASLVLADTGPLYALADASDQHHQRAQENLQRLQKAEFGVAVAYPIVAEAYTLVARRMGLPYARQWLGEVMQRAVLINPEGGTMKQPPASSTSIRTRSSLCLTR